MSEISEAAIRVEWIKTNITTQNTWTRGDYAEFYERDIGFLLTLADAYLAMTWRPISEAPTNQSVLVFVPNREHYGPGIYRAMQVDMGSGRRWMTTAWACGRDLGADNQPTAWMPLPPVPEARP